MCAFWDDLLRVFGFQPDKLFAIIIGHGGAGQGPFANKIWLGFGNDPIHTQIMGRDRPIGFLPDNDKALFGTQNMHGFGAIGVMPCAAPDFIKCVHNARPWRAATLIS